MESDPLLHSKREIETILALPIIGAKRCGGCECLYTHRLLRMNFQLCDTAQRRQPVIAVGVAGHGKKAQFMVFIRARAGGR